MLSDLLHKGHQRDRLPEMLTRAELYDLLGYSGYEAARPGRHSDDNELSEPRP